jgi:hypothetical protein
MRPDLASLELFLLAVEEMSTTKARVHFHGPA